MGFRALGSSQSAAAGTTHHTTMKHTNYLPLIETATGIKFVLNGGWYTENDDGTITLESGKVCRKWTNFPA